MPRRSRKKQALERPAIVRFFAHKVRQVRLSRGLKQVELARLAHLSPAYLARVENAQTECGIGMVEQIATALEVPPCELFPNDKPEVRSVSTELARKRLESVLAKDDEHAVSLIASILTLVDDASSRRNSKR